MITRPPTRLATPASFCTGDHRAKSARQKAEESLQIRRVIEQEKKWTRYGQSQLRTSTADLRGDQKPRSIQRVS